MLNQDQLATAAKLVKQVLALRESKERLSLMADGRSLTVSSFLDDVIVDVPEAAAEQVKTIALAAISNQLGDLEEKLAALGVTVTAD